MLEYEVIWGHIDILVVAVRSLSRSEQVKSLLAGPSPISPMKGKSLNLSARIMKIVFF